MPKILLGSDYFPKFVQKDVLFIDKSLLIKAIIEDGSEVLLITRPRRWGKSLDLSMLQHFFAASVINIPTKGLFDDLKIATVDNGHYMQFQGQHPVILLNLKDVQSETYEGAIELFSEIICNLFSQFPELQNSEILSDAARKKCKRICDGQASFAQIQIALKTLSECLYTHYQQKVYILIDEYDKPLNHAYNYDYFDRLSDFIKVFLGASLKTNPYLEKGVMTGILRLSKANMLSGLNNLKEYNLLGDTYSQYFGFTEQEVTKAFAKTGLTHDLDKVKAWYNGYNIAGLVIYNPWSIANCLENKGQLRPYWVDTADNRLIEQCLLGASIEIKQQVKQLLEGQSIEVRICPHVTFDNLQEDSIALWSLLLFAGYLRLDSMSDDYELGKLRCKVSIPNQEVKYLFFRFFSDWFDERIGTTAKTS